MNAIQRGIRNAFRNTMRTVAVVVILAVAFALSISMLIARQAVNTKINSVRASTGNTVTVSPAGFFGFSGGGTPLTEKQVTGLLSIPHVTALQAALSETLSTSSTNLVAPTPPGFLGHKFGGFGNGSSGSSGFSGQSGHTFTLPIRVLGTNSPGTAVVGGANGGGNETLTSGTAFSATSSKDVAVIGNTLATKNKLTVGSTFTAWNTKITVVGIYSAGSTFANSDVLMPLSVVQKLAGATGQITSATVTVDNINNVGAVSTAISKQLGSAADVTSTQQTVQQELSPLNSVETISTYTLCGAVIGAALILLLSMLMIVRERRREVGVLKAIGATNKSVVGQFVAESTTFTVIGSVVGFIAGVLMSSPITSALVTASSNTNAVGFVRPGGGGGGFGGGGNGFGGGGFGGGGHFHFGGFSNTLTHIQTSAGVSTLVFAFFAAILIAAVGSAVAAGTIVRIRPAEVLRSE